MLALVHDLEASRYLETIEELRQQTGRAPEHTMLGFSSENGRIVLTASFQSIAAHYELSLAS